MVLAVLLKKALHHKCTRPAAAIHSFSTSESIQLQIFPLPLPLHRLSLRTHILFLLCYMKHTRPRWFDFIRFPCNHMEKKKKNLPASFPSSSAAFVCPAPQWLNKERWHLEMSTRVGGVDIQTAATLRLTPNEGWWWMQAFKVRVMSHEISDIRGRQTE